MRRRTRRPRIEFKRVSPFAPTPNLWQWSETTYELFANERLWLCHLPVQEIGTGLSVALPRHYVGLIQPHYFAIKRGFLISAAHPITHGYDGEIRLLATAFLGTMKVAAYAAIDAGCPLALLQIVHAPDAIAKMMPPDVEMKDSPQDRERP